jgi:hypothetical protein
MKTRLLKRLRREADNLYFIFPAPMMCDDMMSIYWNVGVSLGDIRIVYLILDSEEEAKAVYESLKREYVLYSVKCQRLKRLRKL